MLKGHQRAYHFVTVKGFSSRQHFTNEMACPPGLRPGKSHTAQGLDLFCFSICIGSSSLAVNAICRSQSNPGVAFCCPGSVEPGKDGFTLPINATELALFEFFLINIHSNQVDLIQVTFRGVFRPVGK